jgi:Family of unknown function (DUF5330)
MVSKWWMAGPYCDNRHQSKIYGESNGTIFSLNLADLNSMQTFAIYRRSVGIDFPDGRERNKSQPGSHMFFLLRVAFWVGLVLVLLPRDKAPDSDKATPINTSDAISAATAAINDMSQFCKRQPTACDVGGQAANAIGQRAQGGARKVYQYITDKPEKSDKPDKRTPEHTGSIGAAQASEDGDTLTQEDTQIDWRGTPMPSPRFPSEAE